jgi:hypothetical protein
MRHRGSSAPWAAAGRWAERGACREARQAEGGGEADEDAGQRQAHPLEHHHVLHLADLRSEGEADADLVRPLLDGVGHQAVDADRREEQRVDAESRSSATC